MLLKDVFDTVIDECSIELMAAYEMPLYAGSMSWGNHTEASEYAAIIGYSADEIPGGSIALWISRTVLEATCPSSDELTDWLSELLNQLTGRLLNQLLSYDLHLVQSTPVLVKGNQLDLKFSGDHTRHYIFFDETHQPAMKVYFESSFQRDFNVQLNTSSSPSIPEGESIIF